MKNLRQALFRMENTPAMNQWARSQGFPSMLAMATMVDLGSRLAQGEKITDAYLKEVAQVYPAVPFDTLRQYAAKINSHPSPEARADALIGLVASPTPEAIAAGREYIRDYTTQATAAQLGDKLDKRMDASHDVRRSTLGPTRKYEPNTLRADLERTVTAMSGPTKQDVMAALTDSTRREYLADAIENNVDAQVAARGPEGTLRDALDAAWDREVVTSDAREEIDSAELDSDLHYDRER